MNIRMSRGSTGHIHYKEIARELAKYSEISFSRNCKWSDGTRVSSLGGRRRRWESIIKMGIT